MPTQVIDIRSSDDLRDVVHRAVQAIVEGGVVALPTETVYGLFASGLRDDAVARLYDLKGRAANQPVGLAVKGSEDALDYVPDMSPLAQRLARRGWPGPLTLVVPDGHPDSALSVMAPRVREAVVRDGFVGLRAPAHATVLDILRMVPGPVVQTSANQSGGPEPTTAQDVVRALGDGVTMVLDDGPCRFGQPSSVVRIRDEKIEMLRAGVISEKTLKRWSSISILFVCTGNTCRSPMAEALCRKLVAEKLHCPVQAVEDRGVIVASAGIAAMTGGRASPEASEVLAAEGLSVEDHYSQPVTDSLIKSADRIFVMTRSHRAGLLAEWPEAADRTSLLSPDGLDVSDPIGGTTEHYRRCAQQIKKALESRIQELPLG